MNFNPRLREGGDTVGFPIIGFDNDFNPRLREGGDLLSFIAEAISFIFQSTPPRRRRHLTAYTYLSNRQISIHASAKEATLIQQCCFVTLQQFQSTPPRRRRLSGVSIAYCNSMISIHASAKEATEKILELAGIDDISIHASAKEATQRAYENLHESKFQSTPPRRRRPCQLYIKTIIKKNFNPRLREGGDDSTGITGAIQTNFNPRLREGGDNLHLILIIS